MRRAVSRGVEEARTTRVPGPAHAAARDALRLAAPAAALAVALLVAAGGAAPSAAQSPARTPELHDPMPDRPAAPPEPAPAPGAERRPARGEGPRELPPECLWGVEFGTLPFDSLGGHEFRVGFRVSFSARLLRAERPAPDGRGWIPTLPVDNRFRLVFGTAGFGCWNLQANVTAVPAAPGDSVAGLALAWFIRTPAMVESGARVAAQRDTVWLARHPRADDVRHAAHLGRAAGILALERLHRMLGALPARDRLEVPNARRASEPVPD